MSGQETSTDLKNKVGKSSHGGARSGAGRKRGVPNKLTSDVKAMILAALEKAGGETYLFEQAAANPTAFMTLIGKVLPMQVQGDPDAPVEIRITRRVVSE